MNTQSSLLIYNNTGEGVRLFLIPDHVADKHRGVLESCHNKLQNCDGHIEEMDKLWALMCSNPKFQDLTGLWSSFEVGLDEPIRNRQIAHVYYSGFMD
jgi:hypothetical protein